MMQSDFAWRSERFRRWNVLQRHQVRDSAFTKTTVTYTDPELNKGAMAKRKRGSPSKKEYRRMFKKFMMQMMAPSSSKSDCSTDSSSETDAEEARRLGRKRAVYGSRGGKKAAENRRLRAKQKLLDETLAKHSSTTLPGGSSTMFGVILFLYSFCPFGQHRTQDNSKDTIFQNQK